MPISSSTTNDIPVDEIQVLSSEVIVLEDSVGDDIPETEPMSTYSKFCQAITGRTPQNIKLLISKKVHKSS